jgi:hypothetical protein
MILLAHALHFFISTFKKSKIKKVQRELCVLLGLSKRGWCHVHKEKDVVGFLPLRASEMRNYARHKEQTRVHTHIRSKARALCNGAAALFHAKSASYVCASDKFREAARRRNMAVTSEIMENRWQSL